MITPWFESCLRGRVFPDVLRRRLAPDLLEDVVLDLSWGKPGTQIRNAGLQPLLEAHQLLHLLRAELSLVALMSLAGAREILGRVGNAHWEELLLDRMNRHLARRRCLLQTSSGNPGIEESLGPGRTGGVRLKYLCNDGAHQPVVRMSIQALRPPGDDHFGPQLTEQPPDLGSKPREMRTGYLTVLKP